MRRRRNKIKTKSTFVSPTKKENALKDIQDFIRILPKSFAVYGTCLGAHREKGFIAHDSDVDFAIKEEDFSFTLINNLIKEGFKIYRIFGKQEFGLEIVTHRNVKIDLWLFYETQLYYYNCLWDNDKIIKHFHPLDVIPPTTINFESISIPCATQAFVENTYGKQEWKIPQENFNWRSDHKCQKIG